MSDKYTSGNYQRAVGDMVGREVYQCASTLVWELAHKAESFPDYYDELIDAYRGVPDYEEAASADDWRLSASGQFYKADPDQYYLSINLDERGEIAVSVHHCDEPGQGANAKEVWSFNGPCDEAANLDGSELLNLRDTDDVSGYISELGLMPATAELHEDEECGFELSDADSWSELCAEEDIDTDSYEPDIFEHWIVSDWLARKLEANNERVLRDFFGLTVWCRAATGQAILLDGVICNIYDTQHKEAA